VQKKGRRNRWGRNTKAREKKKNPSIQVREGRTPKRKRRPRGSHAYIRGKIGRRILDHARLRVRLNIGGVSTKKKKEKGISSSGSNRKYPWRRGGES